MTNPYSGRGPHPSVGTLAQEAGLLLDVLADRLGRLKGSAEADSLHTDPTRGDEPTADKAGAEPLPGRTCIEWCPICGAGQLLNGERPETAGRLLDGALLIVTTLRSLIPDQPVAPPGPGRVQPSTEDTANGRPGAGFERIDIE